MNQLANIPIVLILFILGFLAIQLVSSSADILRDLRMDTSMLNRGLRWIVFSFVIAAILSVLGVAILLAFKVFHG